METTHVLTGTRDEEGTATLTVSHRIGIVYLTAIDDEGHAACLTLTERDRIALAAALLNLNYRHDTRGLAAQVAALL